VESSGYAVIMNDRCRALIERLELLPHPEGGYFRETYRSPIEVPPEALPKVYGSPRSLATLIHFLLPAGAASHLHRVRSEEVWLFQEGDPVLVRFGREPDAVNQESRLHRDGELQQIIPANWWQEATVCDGPHGYGLVACLVAPGFEFDDFTLAGN